MQKKIINDWSLSSDRHVSYYGEIVTVPCKKDVKVIQGKPSWLSCPEGCYFRTSPIKDFNYNLGELESVRTISNHVYYLGTKHNDGEVKEEKVTFEVKNKDENNLQDGPSIHHENINDDENTQDEKHPEIQQINVSNSDPFQKISSSGNESLIKDEVMEFIVNENENDFS